MDLVKTGRFIAERRKAQGLTQARLAEMLGITDRAVSKWENGKSLPDSSIMLELCRILRINVNDLLCGEVVTVEHRNEQAEKNLLEMVKAKEESDRHLLTAEIYIGVLGTLIFLALVFTAAFVPLENWLRAVLIVTGLIPFAICIGYAIKIEQKAGYYECAKCGHKYVPTYKSVLFARHINRTRYMKCPECGEKSWQKKRISKD